MPFRLNIVPQDFQRLMDKIFKEYKDFCVVYIDDIIVFFKQWKNIKSILKLFVKNSKNMWNTPFTKEN